MIIFNFHDNITNDMYLVFDTDEESARQRLISDKKDMSNIVLESEDILAQGLILRIVDGHE